MAGKIGRPKKPEAAVVTEYSEELAARICAHVAVGKALDVACALAGEQSKPQVKVTEDIVFLWLFRVEAFGTVYRQAKKAAMMQFLEDTIKIADDDSGDTYSAVAKDGTAYDAPNAAAVNRAKLKVAARQWVMRNLDRDTFADPVRGPGGGEGGTSETMLIVIEGGLPDA